MKACQREDITSEFDYVCSFYKDDFQPELLRAQLLTFGIDFQHIQRETYGDSDRKPTIFDIPNNCSEISTLKFFVSSKLSWLCRLPKLRQKDRHVPPPVE